MTWYSRDGGTKTTTVAQDSYGELAKFSMTKCWLQHACHRFPTTGLGDQDAGCRVGAEFGTMQELVMGMGKAGLDKKENKLPITSVLRLPAMACRG